MEKEDQNTRDSLPVTNHFNAETGEHPFEQIEWEKDRVAEIKDATGKIAFLQEGLEFPKDWSQRATDIVASKYFRHRIKGAESKEHSVKQLIGRIADTISKWGHTDGYFDDANAHIFRDELMHLLLHQKAAFNSPVQFNVGIQDKPQCSACFINSVEDRMDSIMELAKTEAMVFKGGSGSGVNLSKIRSSRELLGTGQMASGPVAFMRGLDSFAGVIKSGGATRASAKMIILDADHPDVREFIWCKAKEEKKAHQLIALGYDGSIDGEAYRSVQFQNANNSVSVTDDFMKAVIHDNGWQLKAAMDKTKITEETGAKELMRAIAEATWICGDPGLQFNTKINDWHTCSADGEINACNPCSEYVFLDNSACNLSSLNLMKFVTVDEDDLHWQFDVESFRHAVQIMITAQEIIVGNSSYPTEEIARVSDQYRTLGLGYANLGALLMLIGLPYGSDQACGIAAAITAIMTGEAYAMSARLADYCGPFNRYEHNKSGMLSVIHDHQRAISMKLNPASVPHYLLHAAKKAWEDAVELGHLHGYRNAQVTLLAPTGTIAFMMDCDTTGIEPEFSLVKIKKLIGGGTMRIVNQVIGLSLERLGYEQEDRDAIIAHVEDTGTIEGAPGLDPIHLPIFDCADKPVNGVRVISYSDHIKMCGAVQMFLSGAISKTINLPNEATVDNIMDAYVEGWMAGMKSISIYRDGCKLVQPLSNKDTQVGAVRRNMPPEHPALQHEFKIQNMKGFLTLGMFPEDKELGELFFKFGKQGSTLQGMTSAWAIAVSMGLQRGVPIEDFIKMYAFMTFEPNGMTSNPKIPFTTSIPDYVMRYIATKFLDEATQRALGIHFDEDTIISQVMQAEPDDVGSLALVDAHRLCSACGNLMQRSGNCYICRTCGTTSGCS